MAKLKGWRPKRRVDGAGNRCNADRAEAGLTVVLAYARTKPDLNRYDSDSDLLTDLLADLYHYAASIGVDLAQNAQSAKFHFEVER